MTVTDSNSRALALRVAKSLRDKGRSAEAVLVLSAWASSGPNDAEGQALLAEALRLEPQSAVAKMAFERMEGVPAGDHAELEKALARYSVEELGRLDREGRPAFQRAQVGFNNNLKYKGKPYHVQTEDSGLGKPHVITHVFADGGRVIKSHKRDYSEAVKRADVVGYVRALMKGQHMEMVLALREGRFDPIIDGVRVGGMELLTHPPVVEVAQVGGAKPRPLSERPPVVVPEPDGPVRFTLQVLRSLAGGPARYDPRGDTVILGSSGAVSLPGERFCHPREAMLSWENAQLWLDDLEGGNGVFLRIRSRVQISIGSEFVIGDQLLRLERNPDPNDGPGEGPTYFFSSLKQPSAFRVVQIFEGGALGACALARETVLQIGSARDYVNELVLGRDPLVAPYHCVIEEQAEVFVLTDLGARSGVFVRVAGRQALAHGDELLVGRTRLRVELEGGADERNRTERSGIGP
jgi:pSer/pThr/pTyr-binding forkhead associated (FHA) protein